MATSAGQSSSDTCSVVMAPSKKQACALGSVVSSLSEAQADLRIHWHRGLGLGVAFLGEFCFLFDHVHCYSKVNSLCLLPVEIFYKILCQHGPSICTFVLLNHLAFFENLDQDQIFHNWLWAVTIALSCLRGCCSVIDLAL